MESSQQSLQEKASISFAGSVLMGKSVTAQNNTLQKKPLLNTRQLLYKRNRLNGCSGYASARMAGYSHYTAKHFKDNLDDKINMTYWLERAGLTLKSLAEHAAEGIKADKVISATIVNGNPKDADGQTNDFIDVPDWHARHKYFKSATEMFNVVKDKVQVAFQLIQVYIPQREETIKYGKTKDDVLEAAPRPANTISSEPGV